MTDPDPPTHPDSCDDFMFLLGDWVATIRTQVAGRTLTCTGHWTATTIHEGRIVVDSMEVFGPDGGTVRTMATLRTWVPKESQWSMTYLYGREPHEPVELRGVRVDGEMHLEARHLTKGTTAFVRFCDITQDAFRWEQVDGDPAGATPSCVIDCQRIR